MGSVAPQTPHPRREAGGQQAVHPTDTVGRLRKVKAKPDGALRAALTFLRL